MFATTLKKQKNHPKTQTNRVDEDNNHNETEQKSEKENRHASKQKDERVKDTVGSGEEYR